MCYDYKLVYCCFLLMSDAFFPPFRLLWTVRWLNSFEECGVGYLISCTEIHFLRTWRSFMTQRICDQRRMRKAECCVCLEPSGTDRESAHNHMECFTIHML